MAAKRNRTKATILFILILLAGLVLPAIFAQLVRAVDTGSITGTVTGTESGTPALGGVVVRLYQDFDHFDAGDPMTTTTTTAGTGDYSFGELAASTTYYVSFQDVHHSYNWVEDITVAEGETVVDIALVPEGGSIAGTVKVGSTPIEGATVDIKKISESYNTVMIGYTGADGTYNLGPLPEGSADYLVRFSTVYGDKWYYNKDTQETADPISVVLLTTTPNINMTFAAGGAISGVVTEEGSPSTFIQNCIVDIYQYATNDYVKSGTTDASGAYEISGLADGNYKVWFNISDKTHFSEWYHNASDWDTATQVTIAGGTSSPVNEALTKGAQITGNVKETGTSTNLSGINAKVYLDASETYTSINGVTDANGDYLCGPLAAGSYRVFFEGNATHQPEWYDNVLSWSAPASTVSLSSGELRSGISAYLNAAGTISGTVIGSESGNPAVNNCKVEIWGSGASAEATVYTNSSGQYSTSAWPGSYKIYFEGNVTHLGEWYNDKPSQGEANTVTVTSWNTETANATLTLVYGSIAGHVSSNETGTPAVATTGVAIVNSSDTVVKTVYTDASGNYLADELFPGNYRVHFLGDASHLGEYYNDKSTLGSADTVAVTTGNVATANAGLETFGAVTGHVSSNQAGSPAVASTGVAIINSSDTVVETVYTDASGNYTAGSLWPGSYRVHFLGDASHVGEYYNDKADLMYADQLAVTSGGSVTANAVLDTFGIITGRITSSSGGTAIASSEVKFYNSSGDLAETVVTDANGVYTSTSLWPGSYKVHFMGDLYHRNEWYSGKYSQASADWVTVTSGNSYTINVTLVKLAYIYGTLHGSESGSPHLANTPVRLYDSSEVLIKETTTDSNGNYYLYGLEVGSCKIYFAGDANHRAEYYKDKSNFSSATTITLSAGSSKNINATLSAVGTISGTVTEVGSGDPLAGIRVRAYYDGTTYLANGAYTDASGAYTIGNLSSSSYDIYYVGGTTHTSEWYNNQSVQSAATAQSISAPQNRTGIDASLVGGVSIAGTVTGSETGNPGLSNVEVKIYDSSDVLKDTVYTGLDGSYSVGTLAAGSYKVNFSGDGSHLAEWYHNQSTQAAATLVTVSNGATTTVNEQLAQAFGTISGNVTGSESGYPALENMEVRIYDSDGTYVNGAYTNSSGNYTVANLPSGSYEVYYTGDSNHGAEWFNDRATEELADDITLSLNQTYTANAVLIRATGSISGNIVGNESGNPALPNVPVIVYTAADALVASTSTDASGNYTVNNLSGGYYKIHFMGDANHLAEWNYGREQQADADLTAVVVLETTTVDAVLIEAYGLVTGTVTGYETGNPPLENIEVTVYDSNDTLQKTVYTNASGVYASGDLPAGNYKVHFGGDTMHSVEWYNNKSSQGTADAVTVVLPQATTADALLEEAYGSIAGTVTGSESGTPALSGITVTVYNTSDVVVSTTTTNASGYYYAGQLPDASYKVGFGGNANHLGEYNLNRSSLGTADLVAVARPDTSTVNATLAEAYGSISGTVIGSESGTPALDNSEVRVYTSADVYVGNGYTNSSGFYSIGTLPTGNYKVWYCGNSTHLNEFYNDKSSFGTADLVSVTIPSTTSGINATLTQAYGAISGAVMGSESGNPSISGIQVKVYNTSDAEMGTTTTDASGVYSVGNLPSGSYKVWFGSNANHLAEYYTDKGSLSTADLVSVTIPSTTTNINAVLTEAYGAISGNVKGSDAGTPNLSGITVNVYTSADAFKGTTTTDASGNYSVGNLPTGSYKVFYGGNANHLAEFYNDKASLALADLVSVTIPSTVTINATLTEAYGAISGTVTGNDTGSPALSGITVNVYSSADVFKGTATTDASGNYSVGNLPTGSYKVYYGGNTNHLAEYYNDKATIGEATLVSVTIPSATDVDAVLTEAYGAISGTVTGDDIGDPVLSGIQVKVYNTSDAEMGTTTTDGSGFYSVGTLPTGSYKVWFGSNANHLAEYYNDKSSLGTADLVSVTIPSTTPNINAVLTEAYGAISGNVKGSDTGAPNLSGITVNIYTSADAFKGTTTTDASGNYSVGNLPTGSYKVFYGGNANHLAEYYNDKASLALADLVSVTIPSTTPNINAVLTEAYGAISGNVKGSDTGAPNLSGITVNVYSSADVLKGTTSTDASGNYSIGNLPTGQYKVYFAGNANHLAEYYNDKSSLATADLVSVTIPSTTPNINAVLTEAYGAISGNVKGSESGTSNLSGIEVKVYSSTDELKGTTTTDGSGNYSLGNLPTGSYKVSFGSNANHLSEYYNDKASLALADLVSVTIPSTTSNINAVLTEAYGAISGNVKGSDTGAPNLSGITVNVYNTSDELKGTTSTDASGNYSIGNLPTGSYKVFYGGNANHLAEYYNDKASLALADLVSVTIPTTTSNINAVLTEAYGAISGNVKGSESGTPNLTGIEVKVYSSTDTLMGTTSTDASGNYSVGNLPTGSYKVSFGSNANHLAEYYNDKASLALADLVSVTIPTTTSGIDAVLTEAYGVISGNVKGSESGTPNLSGIEVKVYSSTDELKGTTSTDASGNYSVGNLPTGSYKVSFGSDSTHLAEWNLDKATQGTADLVSVTIPSTTTSNATLTQAFGTISGNVKGSESGTPNLSGIEVKVYTSTDTLIGTTSTDASGNYSIGNLPTGSYKVYFAGNSTHLAEWNLDKATQGSADLVSVTIPSTTTVNATLTQAYGTISGTVTGSETNNLLTAASASFEDGTTGAWGSPGSCTFAASTDTAWQGSRSGKQTCTAAGNTYVLNNVKSITAAGSQYTASARFKGTAGKTIRLCMYGNASGFTNTDVVATGDWQSISVTKTFAAGDTTNREIYLRQISAGVGNICYWDAIQLEAGAVASPLALDGISVTVYDGATPIGSATTAGGGLYSIGNLPSGSYKVSFGGNSTHLGTDNLAVAVVLQQTTTSNATLTQAFGTISGTVTGSESGTPVIDGISVTVYDGATPIGSATTAGGGLYSIGNLPSGSYKVSFGGNSTHLGTDNLAVAVVLQQTTTSNATLTQAFGTISGTVTGSESGTPVIDGISVTVYDGATPIGSATTAGGGLYSIGNLPSGSYKVSFGGNSTHLGTDNLAVAVVLQQTTTSNATLTQAFGTISGTVTGSESGTPVIDGISVTVYDGATPIGSATTAGGGLYSIGNLPSGSYKVSFGGNSTHLGTDNLAVAVVLQQTTTSNATLTQAFGTISGTVTGSETNNLLTAASASFEDGTTGAWGSPDACTFAASTDTAWQGSRSGKQICIVAGSTYVLNNVKSITAAGSQYTASARFKGTAGKTIRLCMYGNASGFTNTDVVATGDWQSISVTKTFAAGDTTNREIYLRQISAGVGNICYWDAIQLEAGAVASPFGLSGISVTVYNGSDQQVGSTATTDGSGFYSVGNLPAGTYRVHFSGDSTHMAADNTAVAVMIQQTTTSNATLTQAFGTISGTVTGSENGNPALNNIEVKIYETAGNTLKATVYTNTSGAYTETGLPTGSYKLRFGGNSTHLSEYYNDQPTYEAANTVSVTIPSTTTSNATLTQAFGTISGTVTGSESGTPVIDGISVTVYDGATPIGSATTAGGGLYSIGNLPSGSYKVSFGGNSTHLGTDNLAVAVVLQQTTTSNATLTQAFGTISGTVTGSESGTPVIDGISVTVYDGATPIGSATTAGGGLYSIGNLPSGSYKVSFGGNSTHLGTDNLAVAVVLQQTTTSNATLTQAFGTISGNVKGSESGTPNLSGIEVKVYTSTDTLIGTTSTDASGNYSIGNLPTGSYKVYFAGNSTHLAEWNLDKATQGSADLVSVTIPSTTTVNATLTQAYGTISGTVTGSETNNLLTAASASFEDGTTGAWGSPGSCTFAASTDTAWQGSRSGKQTCTAAGNTYVLNNVKSITAAGSQYTASARFKGTAGKTIRLCMYGNASGFTNTDVVATGDWQSISVTKTFAAGDTTNREIYLRQISAGVGNICYWDAIQLEAGAVASPLALDGISVTVYDGATPIGSATTAGGGLYSIGNLPSGSYKVSFGGNSTHLGTDNLAVAVVLQQTTTSNATLTQAFGTISGTVTGSESGTPVIDGISVTVYDGATPIGSATTAGGGLYSIGNLPSGSYKVSFGGNSTHLGTDNLAVAVVLQQTTTSNATLTQAFGTISGTVTGSESGTPVIDGISVTVYDGATPIGSATTAGGGLYSIGNLPSGSYKVSFGGNSTHLGTDNLAVAVVLQQTTTSNATLTQAFGTISGTVTGSESGTPVIDGISVTVYDGATPIGSATTAGGGLYSIGNLPSGSYKVSFGGNSTHLGTDNLAVAVVLQQTTTSNATLTQAFGTISGTVTGSESGTPVIDGISVTVYDGATPIGSATTAGGGLYSIGNLPSGSYKVSFGGNSTHLGTDNLAVAVVLQQTTTSNATLTQAFGTISGTVTGSESGTPVIDGISVTVYDGATPIGSATTAGGGLYSIGNLPSGSYKVSFGGNSTHLGTDNLAVAVVLQQTTTSNATLTQAFGTISGTVTGSESGTPVIDGISVTVYDGATPIGSATTAGGGLYSIGNLPSGSYKVSFGGNSTHLGTDNLAVAVVLQQTTTSNATLTQAFGTISGTVTGSESGTPVIDGISVTVYDGATPIGSATTAGGGLYSIGNLPSGSYKVSFGGNSTHLGTDNLAVAVVLQQTTTSNATLTQAFGTISGNVKGSESGTPNLSGIEVKVYTSTDTLIGTTSTDASGNYSIGNLPTGSYKVYFAGNSTHLAEWNLDKATQGSADLVSVTIPSTTTVNATLTQAYGTISGTVTGSETNNLLTAASASFEDGTTGAWGSPGSCTFAASTDTAWQGSRSGKQTCTAAGNTYVLNNVKSITAAGSQYTASARFKGTAGKTIRLCMYGNASGFTNTDVVATGDWQSISVTKTFAAGDTTNREIYLRQISAGVGNICYWDAIQLEAGAVASPFGLSGISVTVYNESDQQVGSTATTGENGNYSIGNLPTGSYKVYFAGNSTHLAEWNLDKATQGSADLVSVTIPSTTTVNATLTQAYGTISGTVTGSETNNLLTAASASFEDGTTGAWGSPGSCTFAASTDTAWQGSRSGKQTCTAAGNTYVLNNVKSITAAGSQYTASARFKGTAGKTIRLCMYGNASGFTNTDVVATGDWQSISVTKTFAAGDTTNREIYLRQISAGVGNICYWDAIQLEAGAVASPFGLSGISVTVYNESDQQVGSTATTGENGNYSIGNLPAGTYRVHFSGDSTHLGTDNTGVAVVLQQTTTSNAVLTQEAYGTISGTVTGSETNNLLTAASASFEDGTTGAWGSPGSCTFAASTDTAWQGSRSGKQICIVAGSTYVLNNVKSITAAGSQYTASARFKGTAGKTIRLCMYGNASGFTNTDVVATGDWQSISVTKTFAAGDTTNREIYLRQISAGVGNICYWDAIQLEAGAVASPFGLSGISVTVYNGSDQQVGSTATTDGSGFYSIGNLPVGTYRVHFSGDSTHMAADNTAVAVMIQQTTTSNAVLTQEAYGTISGTVTGSETNNLLTAASASFEDGTTGAWGSPGSCTFAASTDTAWQGSRSGKQICIVAGSTYVLNNVKSITAAGSQYTASARFKGTAGKTIRLCMYGNASGFTNTDVVATGDWQSISVTKTFAAGDTTNREIYLRQISAGVGNICYWDAIQLEAGAVASPFGLSGISVTVYNGSDQQVGSTATTDGSGFYSIGNLPVGTYRVHFSGDSTHMAADNTAVAVMIQQTTTSNAVLTQEAFGTISGTVTGSESGTPVIDGISVTVYDGATPIGSATTAGGGLYSIGNLPVGTYRVHFSGDSTHMAADNTGVAVVLQQTTTSNATLTQAFGTISGTVTGSETNNLLTAASASFEDGTTGAWGSPGSCTFAASTDTAWQGSRSGKQTCTAAGNTYVLNNVKSITAAGSQYTASARFKGTAGKTIRLCMYGNASGFTNTDVVATGDWQSISVTKTFAAGDTTNREIYLRQISAGVGNICYWDAIQLEAGAVASPFGLSGISVTVYNESDQQVGSTATTGENGNYSIGNLPAGTYRVHFSGDSTHLGTDNTGVAVVLQQTTTSNAVLTLK